jgi:peroxiredoxin Q/BCP
MESPSIAVGERAPNWSMKDQAGRTVKLSDFIGKQSVVLIFYPGDLTPGCTLQLCAIRDDWEKFRTLGIAVFGVNHADADSHQRFIDKHHFPFPLLIDKTKKTSAAYGAVKKFFKATVIKRSVVGIDKEGVIRYLKRGMPKDADILKTMKTYS